VQAAVDRLRAEAGADADPLEILRQLGGRQMAAVAGAIIAARVQKTPVLLDGYAVCAAGAVLQRAQPGALDHCRAAHRSAQLGHGALLDQMGLSPLLDLGLAGEGGLGSVTVLGLLRTAAAAVEPG
jgi:nicotinate-nucleotide--dimethylbenzimidazole phosphoribosyltransferase